jgi:hypothetical protein
LLKIYAGEELVTVPLGEVKVNDRATLGLKVTRQGYKEFDLCFDKETHLPIKIETKLAGPNNQEGTFEYFLSESHWIELEAGDTATAAKKLASAIAGQALLAMQTRLYGIPELKTSERPLMALSGLS